MSEASQQSNGSSVLWAVISWVFGRLVVLAGAAALTLACFLVLPLMQAIAKPPAKEYEVRSVDTASLPTPPPPPEQQPEEEPEPEEPKPELAEQSDPLSYEQLQTLLNPNFGGGGGGMLDMGDLSEHLAGNREQVQGLFHVADLDQKPRVVYQPSPRLSARARAKTPGTVYVIFIVDETGATRKPIAQDATSPALVKPAVAAVKRWRFEPGKRGGKPVRFRMRVPIKFPDMR